MLVLALQFSRSATTGEATTACYPLLPVARRNRRAAGARGMTPSKRKRRQSLVLRAGQEAEPPSTSCGTEPTSAPTRSARAGQDKCLTTTRELLLRKEVIQPHLPVRLPCYDFTPITDPTFDGSFLAVRPPASGVANFRGVTGGVYKARERIHPGVLIRDY